MAPLDPFGERSTTVGGIGLDLDRGAGVEGCIPDLVRIAEQRLGSKDILLPGGFAEWL
jgi:hypothetical protein